MSGSHWSDGFAAGGRPWTRHTAGIRRRSIAAGLGGIVLAAIVAGTTLAASIANGGFETGDFGGWTVASATGNGSWFVYTGTFSPVVGATVPAPPEGTYAAIADESDADAQLLYQDIALEPGFAGTLTFTWFYVNHAGAFSPGPTLDPGSAPNQQVRVDLVSPAADPWSVAAADVIAPILATPAGAPNEIAPTPVSLDLTPFAGQTVRLRFVAVETEGYLEAGVDAVAVTATQVQPTWPTAAAQCKRSGWRTLTDADGAPFRNQGDCVSWVEVRSHHS